MSSLLQPASNMPAPSAAEVMSARTSERSINVELPTQQAIFAPQPSVHALKPLTKILSFGPSARKPLKAEPWAPALAWSTDVKSRGRGLIGAERADFSKKGQRVNDSAAALAAIFRKNPASTHFPADIEEFLPPLPANHVAVEIAEVVKGLRDGVAGGRDHGGGVPMRAAGGVPQDRIGHAKAQHVLRADFLPGPGFLGPGSVPPPHPLPPPPGPTRSHRTS